jgi:membrane protein
MAQEDAPAAAPPVVEEGARKSWEIHERFVEILSANLEESGNNSVRWLAWRVKILMEIAEKFWQDNCPTFAASLAYTTLLTLAPLAAVSLSILASFSFTDLGAQGIKVNSETALEFVFNQFLPPNEELASSVKRSFETFQTNAAPVSLFGLLLLISFAIWMLSTIEAAFNMIWKVDTPRPVINQFVAYWSTVTFAPILIILSIYFTAKVQALAASAAYAEYTYIQVFLMKGSPLFLTFIAFFMIYRLIPNTNVHFRPALWGALAAGAMFEIAKYVFNWYLREWASYQTIYGGLAIIPIFLFWLYVTWLIVLGGSVIAYAIQYPKEVKSKKKEGFDRRKYPHYYALRILLEASRRFLAGKGALEPWAVQQKLEITNEFYNEILLHLRKLDLVALLDSDTFLIKKPLDSIRVADVMANISGEMLSAAPEPLDGDRKSMEALFGLIRDSMEKGLDNLTLLGLTQKVAADEKARADQLAPFAQLRKEGQASSPAQG